MKHNHSQYKEIEKIIKDSADKVQTRDFSEVWQSVRGKLQDDVAPEESKRVSVPVKKNKFRWLPACLAGFAAALVCIIVPIAVQNADKPNPTVPTYIREDQLVVEEVTYSAFLSSLEQAEIDHVDFSDYEISTCNLWYTSDTREIKGGTIGFTDNALDPSFFVALRLYTEDVKVEAENATFEHSATIAGEKVFFHLRSSEPDGGAYIYDVKANVNNVNYLINHTGYSENIEPFLLELFT